jgi:SAM-dependent methyltransferase
MTNTELLKKWQKEENASSLKGWDFSCLSGRWDCPNPPWDYRMIIKSYLKDADTLFDMGTGGGEFLLTIGHPYEKTYATEAYEPNFELCKKELLPLGITVLSTFTDDKLPFEDNFFDFIINRHESFDLSEVNRILKHGGYFITQQVDGQNCYELASVLNDKPVADNPSHTIESYENNLIQLGFQVITKDEAKLLNKFFDIGAIIFYAKACVWEIPKFSVATHFDKLCKIQHQIDKYGFFQATGGRFLLVARKL